MMSEEVKPYSQYSSADFFDDDRYIRFILHPTVEEDVYWQELVEQYPVLKPRMTAARIWILLLNRQKVQEPVRAADEIWHRIASRMESYPQGAGKISPMRRTLKWAAGVAAILLFCLLMGEWTRHGTHRYQTGYGVTNSIDLPDGSLVMLNGNSSIRYNRGWSSARPRELWLEGEAFFQVKHVAIKNRWQQSDSFRVHVGDVNVTVTGTKFNIRSRRSMIEITLLEGALRIDKGGKDGFSKLLRPGESFLLDSSRQAAISRPVNASSKNAWTRQEMDLDGYTLEEILRVLEDNYGYEIILRSPELAQKRMTGTIPASSAEDIIFVIEKVFNVQVNRIGNRLVITKY